MGWEEGVVGGGCCTWECGKGGGMGETVGDASVPGSVGETVGSVGLHFINPIFTTN